jgi:hypothetical protein
MSDIALCIWLRFATRSVAQMQHAPHWLIELSKLWMRECDQCISGLVDPHLDVLVDRGRVEAMLALVRSTNDLLLQFGQVLPLPALKSLEIGGNIAWQSDVPVQRITDVGEAIANVISRGSAAMPWSK